MCCAMLKKMIVLVANERIVEKIMNVKLITLHPVFQSVVVIIVVGLFRIHYLWWISLKHEDRTQRKMMRCFASMTMNTFTHTHSLILVSV